VRLGIFVIWPGREAGGPETYEHSLVRALAAVDHENEYDVFCLSRKAADSFRLAQDNVRFHVLRPGIRWVSIPVSLPLALLGSRVDLMHMTSVPPPFSPMGYVFTMHSFSTFAHPEFYHPVILWRLNKLILRGLAKARMIVCVSENVRDLIAERFHIAADRLAVAYHGVGHEFRPVPREEAARTVREKYGVADPYMLFVGKLQAGKNIQRLLQAYHTFRQETRSPLKLLLAGKKTWPSEGIDETIDRLGLATHVIRLGHLDHDRLPILYSGADMFVFPSLEEGFGIPVIEAMACGVPVITSNLSGLPEVAGDAALLVDPYSVEQLAEAMWKLSADTALRSALRARGFERARQFTWERAARETLAAYRRAAPDKRARPVPAAAPRTSVVHLIHTMAYGGVETALINWIRGMDAMRFAVHLVCFANPGGTEAPFVEAAERHGLTVEKIPWSRRKPLIRAARALARLLRVHQADILHTHGWYADFVGAIAKRLAPVKTITTLYVWSDFDWRRNIIQRIDQHVIRTYDQITGHCEETSRRTIARGIPRERVKTLSCGFEANRVELSAAERLARRRAMGVADDTRVLVNVARFYPEKAQDALLRSFVRIRAHRPDAHLWIAGVGPLEESLRALSTSLGLDAAVSFLGFVRELPELLALADVQVHPAVIEGVPLAICSGMAAGLPIVASAVGGLPEVLENGESGVLVPPGDETRFADAVLDLLARPEEAARLGHNARRFIENDYSLPAAVRRVEQTYDELMGRPVPAPARSALGAAPGIADAPMRVGVFVTWAGREAGGPETYEHCLVRALAALDGHNEYEIFCLSRSAAESFGLSRGNVHFHVLSPGIRWISIPVSLPLALMRSRVDLVHVTSVPPPLSPTDYVFTMHDISMFTHPEFYPPAIRWRLKNLLIRGMERARVVLCISGTVRDLIAERFHIPADRLAVAYHGVGDGFRPMPGAAARTLVRDRYGIREPYMLFVGKLTARKNVVRILEAYHRFRREFRSELRLVLVGKRTWKSEGIDETIARLALDGNVIRPGYVADPDLPALYSAAETFVFPSLDEGFGLPVLEAMACGTPVLTSQLSCLPEIAGDAALFVNPLSVDTIAEGMWRLATDAELREVLRERGIERARSFTWSEAARRTLAAYHQAQALGPRR